MVCFLVVSDGLKWHPSAMKISLIPKPHILLADNNGKTLLQLATLLSDTRAEMALAHSPEEFQRLALTTPYDLIITTFAWSLIEPQPLPQKMRSEGLNTPLIVLLNEPDEALAERLTVALLCGGAKEVLSLPVSTRRLHRKVSQILSTQREKTMFSVAQKLSY